MASAQSEVLGVDIIDSTEWARRGRERFGPDVRDWRFVCPACGNVTSARDWIEAGVFDEGDCSTECIGVYVGGIRPFEGSEFEEGRPCQYRANGLIRLSPILVTFARNNRTVEVFDFAPLDEVG